MLSLYSLFPPARQDQRPSCLPPRAVCDRPVSAAAGDTGPAEGQSSPAAGDTGGSEGSEVITLKGLGSPDRLAYLSFASGSNSYVNMQKSNTSTSHV